MNSLHGIPGEPKQGGSGLDVAACLQDFDRKDFEEEW